MKKLLSFTLALVLCLSLAVPAFAAAPHDVDMGAVQSYAWNYGGDSAGAKITLNGVIGESTAMFQEHEYPCYDVVVGGGFTLDMTFPKGQNREYSVMLDPVVLNGDMMDMDLWPVSEDDYWNIFSEKDHKSQYVFTGTEAMVSKPGDDMTFQFYVGWFTPSPDEGEVDFLLRFHSASEIQKTAYASTQTAIVDGKTVEFYAYALRDENGYPTNYIKLRDVAKVLNGSKAQFEVSWNGAINLETGKPYTPNGSEMIKNFEGDQPYEICSSTVNVNGVPVKLDAITLTDANGGAYNYFKFRDLGKALGFNVSWIDGIVINSNEPYSDAN